jgi:hypothetical protein
MASFGQQLAQALEERHVVRNRISIRKDPVRVFESEVDQAGHIVPAPEIQSDDVIAKLVDEFFHLISERMRFNQRHTLDVAAWKIFCGFDCFEKIAPPQGLFR